MSNWYERALDQIDQELQDGVIDDKEYRRLHRDIEIEYEEEARQAAQNAYDEYF